MTRNEILNMPVGQKIDEYITIAMINIYEEQHEVKAWSTNNLAALELWDFAADLYDSVGIIRFGDSPNIISQFCAIKDGENEASIMTGNWIESLCKAFLLFYYGWYGDNANPEFEEVVKNLPLRNPH